MLKNTAPGNFIFYILIYFFLLFLYLLSNSSAATPRVFVFTYGIDSNIDIKGFTKAEVSECVKVARENWEKSGLIKFKFSKTPDILITHYSFSSDNDYVGFYDASRKRLLIETDPQKRLSHFKWNKISFTHCIVHEFGHFFGLSHSAEKNSVMQPRISNIEQPSQNDFQSLRIALMNRKYK